MKIRTILLSSCCCILLFGFGKKATASDLYWYVASSMVKPSQEIVTAFNQEEHPFTVLLISGGSGQLLSKIAASRKGDLYTPAASSYIQKTEELKMLKDHRSLLLQTPVFALSTSGQEKIKTWADLDNKGVRLGLGNPKTMALGRLYLQIEKKMGEQLATEFQENKVVEAVNLSQIVNYLQADIVDAGIAFDSTSVANNLQFVTIPEAFNQVAVAPLIRLTSESDPENSSRFIAYLMDNLATFEKYGFHPAIQ